MKWPLTPCYMFFLLFFFLIYQTCLSVYLTRVWDLVCFLGCQSIWQAAAESQRPPRGSALACPHCLAGDRSDMEANTCSSEEGDLVKCWPLYNPPNTHTHPRRSTHASMYTHAKCTVYHPWQVTWNRTLKYMFPPGTLLPLLYVFFSLAPLLHTTQPCEHNKLNACYSSNNTPGILNRPAHLQPCRCFRLQAHLWSGWLCNTQ